MYSIDDVAKDRQGYRRSDRAELARQNSHIELIASENWVSKAVMAAMGSLLPINMRKDIRGRDFTVDVPAWMRWKLLQSNVRKNYSDVNMQMYSHTPEHRQIWQSFCSMLQTGDTVMGMNLDHGGHLTHGSPANMSGTYFKPVYYGVNDDGVIDYEEVRRIAIENKPKLIVAGASAYARVIDF